MSYRGPDDAGSFDDGILHLEHLRLSILDLSENGHQPMFSADGNFVIIFNGEIYNHHNIRKLLLGKGYNFKSTSDTETLLYGFIEYGPDIVKNLNGIFAFAIYNKREKTVFIARDQLGIKPLYYFDRNNTFLFASELKAFLRHPSFERKIDYFALFNYLQYLYCPTNDTPFEHVKRLPPGHHMTISITGSSFKAGLPVCYYDIPFDGQYEELSEREWIDRLDEALSAAVKSQLLSDVPVGFFLSGGLDSSLIVALAKEHLTTPFPSFTIAAGEEMKQEGFADDLGYAKRVAKHLGVRIEVLDARPKILQDFDKMIWHLDEPQADPAAIHVYNISSGARKRGIKVLLGGTAGDDLFSGYRRHQALKLERFMVGPRSLRAGVAAVIARIPAQQPLVRRLKKLSQSFAMEKPERLASYFKWSPDQQVMALFNPDHRFSLQARLASEDLHANLLRNIPAEKDDLNKMLYWEIKTFLVNHNLNYTDKMSMAASVEARVPFLDLELVNLSTRIPPDLKMKGKETKYILKKVAERYLPHDVIYRPKTGFGAPVRKWIENDLREMIDSNLSRANIQARGVFSYEAIQNLIQANRSRKVDASYQIFGLLAIESWIKQFAD
jgi:asparagine synthase (glutamine-hydrolysing)